MLKLLPLIVAMCLLALVLACSKPEPPEPTPAVVTFRDAIPLRYYEECRGCGATFRDDSLVETESRGRFQLKLTIQNTGERGNLDLSAVTSTAYALTGPQSELYSSRFEEERRAGRISILLRLIEPPAYSLSHFLNARGSTSAGPIVPVGETWEGWLVFSGALPEDTRALILNISDIVGDRDISPSSGWVSYAPGQPFIVVGER